MGLGAHLLFTSRRRDDEGRFGCVEVSVLPEDAALDLLLSSPGRRPLWEAREALEGAAEIAAARDVCRALGALPLAVVLAAAFLARNPKVTLAAYRGRIGKHGALPATDTNNVREEDVATRHPAAVEATLASQWEALESEEARLVLRTAALLDEAAEIPRARLSLLTGLAAVAAEGFAAPMEEALQELAGLSLVEELEEVTRKLPAELQVAQRNAILTLLSERMIAWLEETSMNPDKIPMSAAALRFKAAIQAEGKQKAILLFLGGRGLAVTAEERAMIEGCEDPTTLDRWIAKAGAAASVSEVLEPEKKARAKRSSATATTRRARTAKRSATRP